MTTVTQSAVRKAVARFRKDAVPLDEAFEGSLMFDFQHARMSKADYRALARIVRYAAQELEKTSQQETR